MRTGRADLSVTNAMFLVVFVAILGATAIPLIEKSSRQAKSTALLQNLQSLRRQIERYRVEHHGHTPMLHEGTLPQLLQVTNGEGVLGVLEGEHSFGPYLQSGIPVNSLTGRSIVVRCDEFPPTESSGNGGWLYHQQTGQIAVDLPEFLTR